MHLLRNLWTKNKKDEENSLLKKLTIIVYYYFASNEREMIIIQQFWNNNLTLVFDFESKMTPVFLYHVLSKRILLFSFQKP